MTREERVATTFVELADSLVEDFDVIELMGVLTRRCVEVLEASQAGLLLVDALGALRPVAATSEAVEVVELFQMQSDEGPCRDCFRSGSPVSTPDLADERGRWPRFAQVALDEGLRSAHAVPLRLRGATLGTLNLFRAEPGAFAPADIVLA